MFTTAWHDVDLTFIFTPECDKLFYVDSDYHYFQTIRENNPHTPIRQVVLCHTASLFKIAKSAVGYQNMDKSTRSRAVVIPLDTKMAYKKASGYLKCESLMYIASKEFRQEYLIGRTGLRRDNACLTRAAQFIGTSKLLLFEENLTFSVFIPCLTCNSNIFAKLETISIAGIKTAWDNQNRNMHKYLAYIWATENVTCGMKHSGFENLNHPYICPIKVIGEKYNLTITEAENHEHVLFSYSKRSFGAAIFLTSKKIPLDDSIYQVNFRSINFITITNPPSSSSGVETFMSPLDVETWTCLLISSLAVAGFLTWIDGSDGIFAPRSHF